MTRLSASLTLSLLMARARSVFTQDPYASLGSLELDHLDLLLQVWADRTRVVGGNPQIQYVLPFENRGVEGVTCTILMVRSMHILLCRPSQHACGSASRLITE